MKKPERMEEQNTRFPESPVGRALETRLEESVFRRRSLKRQTAGILLFFVIILLLTRVLFGLARVEGCSMYPEYHEGDLIIYSRVTGDIERNDVVLVEMPDGRTLIKRVIGMPGEEVYIDSQTGTVFIDGVELEEEYGPTEPEGYLSYPAALGEGEYFVLGDNRGDSMDSRYYGPVKEEWIRGKVWMIFRMSGRDVSASGVIWD